VKYLRINGNLCFDKVLAKLFFPKVTRRNLRKRSHDVIGKPVRFQHGDDVVLIGQRAGVRHARQVVRERFILVGEDQVPSRL